MSPRFSKELQLLLYGLLAGIFPASSLFAQEKMGFVDLEFVMERMPEKVDVEKKLAEYTHLIEWNHRSPCYALGCNSVFTPGDSIETRLRNMACREIEHERKKEMQQLETEIKEKHAALLQPIEARIRKAVQIVAEKRGYTLVLNQRSPLLLQGMVNLSPVSSEDDLTKAVLAQLGIE